MKYKQPAQPGHHSDLNEVEWDEPKPNGGTQWHQMFFLP